MVIKNLKIKLHEDEALVTFTSSLGGVLGQAAISKRDLDLFRIIGKISKDTCIFIEDNGYEELNDNHTKIKPCWRRKIKNDEKDEK